MRRIARGFAILPCMIRRVLAPFLLLIVTLLVPASAEERVTIGTMRQIANGALFLADAKGYFKAEGLTVDMTAYASDTDVADALALGATDFGLAGFTPTAFNHAGSGRIKAVAARVREKREYEGNELVASTTAYAHGLREFENLAAKVVAIDKLGSPLHYQLGQIARIKKFDFKSMTLKPMQTYDEMARAVGTGKADAALLPAQYARELLLANQARLIGWYSELDEQQFGALFVSAKMIETKRATVEKFVRAYQRGAADYLGLLKLDRGKRTSSPVSRELSTVIARYVFPGQRLGAAAATVENGVLYMDPKALLDVPDIERQIEWFKAQGLIAAGVDAQAVVDTSFLK